MSADEIRRLADSNAIHRPKCRTSEKFPRCREWCPSEDSKKCKEADEVRAVLLAHAAIVERLETELKSFVPNKLFEGNTNEIINMLDYILKGEKDERN